LDALIDDPHLVLQSLDVNPDGSITIVVTPKDPSQGFNRHHNLVGLRSSTFNNFAIGERSLVLVARSLGSQVPW
jgi:hypothetical protein